MVPKNALSAQGEATPAEQSRTVTSFEQPVMLCLRILLSLCDFWPFADWVVCVTFYWDFLGIWNRFTSFRLMHMASTLCLQIFCWAPEMNHKISHCSRGAWKFQIRIKLAVQSWNVTILNFRDYKISFL